MTSVDKVGFVMQLEQTLMTTNTGTEKRPASLEINSSSPFSHQTKPPKWFSHEPSIKNDEFEFTIDSKSCSTTSEKLFSTSPSSIARNDLDNHAIKSKHKRSGGKQRSHNGINICSPSKEKRQLSLPKKIFKRKLEAVNELHRSLHFIASNVGTWQCWVGNLAEFINSPIETSAEISTDWRHAAMAMMMNKSTSAIKAVYMCIFSPSAASMSSWTAIFLRFIVLLLSFEEVKITDVGKSQAWDIVVDPWDCNAFKQGSFRQFAC